MNHRQRISFLWASLMALALVISACAPDGQQGSSISVSDIAALENSAQAQFQLSLSAPSAEPVTVEYALLEESASAGEDYQPANGVLRFEPGQTSASLMVTLVDDSEQEGSEQFLLQLGNPINASLADSSAAARIIDDDGLESVSSFDPHWGPVGVFTDAETCSQCHRASQQGETPAVMRYPDAHGEDVSPATQWQHSMMARAFDDPYFQAKMQDEVSIFPELSGFIEDKCLTCHAGMGRTHAHQTNTGLSQENCPLGDGCYRYAQALEDMHGREGVSCTLCHQVKDEALGTDASFSGAYAIAAPGDAVAMTIYGPYENPHNGGANAMFNQSGFSPQYGQHMTNSALCASCHTLYTPSIDVNSQQPTGRKFLEQAAYLEWQNSEYASGRSQERHCQDCHMADPQPGVYSTQISVMPNGDINTNWPERSPFAEHSMVGGNTHLLAIMQRYRSVLGIESNTSEAGFEEKIAQTRSLLHQAASVGIEQLQSDGEQLDIAVRITNHTGHKLPSGFPSRRMWLHLRVKDGSGQTLFESGAPDAIGLLSVDAGHLASECLARTKPAGFSNEKCYEPHRDLIQDEDEVAIYEAVMADTNQHITYVLLYADSYLKDNRLPPAGFTDAGALDAQTIPAGIGSDSDYNRDNGVQGSGSDLVHYRLPLNDRIGPFSVEARLLYQAVQPSFVGSLHGDGGRVDRFRVMYEDVPPTVETLASDSRQL